MKKMNLFCQLLIIQVTSSMDFNVRSGTRYEGRGLQKFWEHMLPPDRNEKNQFIGPRNVLRRQTAPQSLPQVLMTQCPLNTRCVDRHFCDLNGMITIVQNNNLDFQEDKRGLIACVDSERNVLGVCCTDVQVILNGGRPVRQDDVFQVTSANNKPVIVNQNGGTFLNENNTEDPVENAINQENILPKVDDGKGPLVVININAENADIDSDINKNPNVQTNVNDNTISNVPNSVFINPSIPDLTPITTTAPPFQLSPEDVMTILNMMNDNRNVLNTNNDPIFRTCPAATVCVDRNRCDFNGVISDNVVSLSPRLVQMRVALNRCESPRRQTSDKVCCRDPNYSNGGEDEDEEENDFGNYDFMDFDEVFMYPYKQPKEERLYYNEMTTRKPKQRRTSKRPSKRPSSPVGPKRRRRHKTRKTLEFYTNG